MKITLHDPPEGFEAEAESRKVRHKEWFRTHQGEIAQWDVLQDSFYEYIVLTTRKHKYWRLDPVSTFAEASTVPGHSLRYGLRDDGIITHGDKCYLNIVQWLKLTECEE